MFEDENDQDGKQVNNQSALAGRIASLFRVPQLSGQGDGDFVNRGALRIDPATGNAYRQFGLPTASTTTNGQNAAGQNPTYLPPIQARDDQGKTVPKYRMGIGQRILATVANFANGVWREWRVAHLCRAGGVEQPVLPG